MVMWEWSIVIMTEFVPLNRQNQYITSIMWLIVYKKSFRERYNKGWSIAIVTACLQLNPRTQIHWTI